MKKKTLLRSLLITFGLIYHYPALTANVEPELLVEEHTSIWNSMVLDYNSNTYTIDSPLIEINPYSTAPLSALIAFKTDEASRIRMTISDQSTEGTRSSDIIKLFNDNDVDHFIPISGLISDQPVNVLIEAINSEGETVENNSITLTGDPLPTEDNTIVPMSITTVSDPDRMHSGLTFSAPMGYYNMALDENYKVRWYLDETYSSSEDTSSALQNIVRLDNGHLYLQTEHHSHYEVDILGRCISYSGTLPYSSHHDMYPMADGNYIINTEDPNDSLYVEDVLGIIDPVSNEIVKTLNLKEVLTTEPIRYYQPNIDDEIGGAVDWFHLNTAVKDDRDNNSTGYYVLSARHQNALFAMEETGVDPETKAMSADIKWILGNPLYWSENEQPYLLTPIDENGLVYNQQDPEVMAYLNTQFWTWGQHSVRVLEDLDNNPDTMDIVAFDNGNFRAYPDSPNTSLYSYENHSRGVHFRITLSSMQVQKIWDSHGDGSLPSSVGSRYYSTYVGNVDYLDNSMLINSGGIHLSEDGLNLGSESGDPAFDRDNQFVCPTAYLYEVSFTDNTLLYGVELQTSCNSVDTEGGGYFTNPTFKAFRSELYAGVEELM